MSHPTIRFPLRITEVGEAIAVLDAVGTHCGYIYFCDEPTRQQSTKRVTKAEAVEMAKVIARALTAEFSSQEP